MFTTLAEENVCLAAEGAKELSSAVTSAQIGKMREDSKGRNTFWPLLTIFAVEKWRSKKSLDYVFKNFFAIRFFFNFYKHQMSSKKPQIFIIE